MSGFQGLPFTPRTLLKQRLAGFIRYFSDRLALTDQFVESLEKGASGGYQYAMSHRQHGGNAGMSPQDG